MRGRRGFTLIEVALMLAVLGLLLGLGVSLIGPLVKRSKLVETRENVKEAKEALVGFAVRHGYLPEDSSYDATQPATAFQVAGAKGTDAYGRALRYVAAPELQWDNSTPLEDMSDCNTPLRVDLCAETATSLSVIQEGVERHNVAFMIVSAGENQNLQTKTEIYGIDFPGIDDFPDDGNRPEPYDDVVEYVALDELQALRGCRRLVVVTPEGLPSAEEGQPYSYAMQAEGGVPPYTWVGSAPDGLNLSPEGILSGAVLPGCDKQLTFTATVCDWPGQSVEWHGWLPVRRKPLTITTVELPVGYEGSNYSAQIAADGGSGEYYCELSEDNDTDTELPTGLQLYTEQCEVSGVPDTGTSGAYKVTVKVLDNNCEQEVEKTFGLTIQPASPGPGPGPPPWVPPGPPPWVPPGPPPWAPGPPPWAPPGQGDGQGQT